MPPMVFASLVGVPFNLLFAGVLPGTSAIWNTLDGTARIHSSAPSVNP